MQDKEIVELYWNRDEKAIAETTVKYGKYCKSIAMNIVCENEDAEECVNDTYLQTWNSIPPHRPGLLSAFLGKIVRNLAFNKYKSIHSAKRGGYEVTLILDELCEIISDNESVEDHALRQEMIKDINSFIRTLPEEKQYMFIRRYWYSDSIMDIAKQCGRTENSISVELSRIRNKLRVYLIERGYDL
ncbi:MAG: sigma-70 family RNA polymerase sigma factor [Ruminococcus sp.]|nr:sigma-70 family RNA polymerase sigma factor [Ruminococcus sp.]